MRVLQLHTRYRQRGGEDVVVDAEASLLREAGHEVRQTWGQNPTSPLASMGALALAPWNPLQVRRIAEAVNDFKPDVAHVHNTWFAMSPAVITALNEAGVPVVMTLHNYRLACANGLLFRDGGICEECVGTGPWRAVKYGCYRDSRVQSVAAAANIDLHQRLGTWQHRVDVFIALSEFQRELMIRAGLPAGKILVKPNSTEDPGGRSGLPGESKVVMFAGRLSYEKGVDLLIEAWRLAALDDLELQIAGDGPLLEALAATAPPGVTFLGRLGPVDLSSRMRASRAGVLPSRCYEGGTPLVLSEFFATGTPVLVPSHGAISEFVTRGPGDSWVVPTLSREAWAEAIQGLQDELRCDEGGREARRQYEANFTRDAVMRRLEGIYLRAMSEFKEGDEQ